MGIETDFELEASCKVYVHEIEELEEERARYQRELQELRLEAGQVSQTDYFCQLKDLEARIAALKIEMSKWKKTSHQSMVKEKHVHVTYIPNPEAEALRREIENLKSRNKSMTQKLQFHTTRTLIGGKNYTYEDTVTSDGKKVRGLRKSLKNSQNQNAEVMGGVHMHR